MRTALVTGSTSGIGLAIATGLIQEGWQVTLNGLGNKAEIDTLVAEFDQNHKGKVMYHPADLSDPDQIQDFINESVRKWKRIDLVVNNAGIQYMAPVEEFPLDMWQKVINLNLSACFYTTRAVLPVMRAQEYGRIVNVASVHGLVGSKNKSAYVAAKHGVLGLTKVVALETAGTGITCNALCPGWVLTPLVEKQIQDKADQEKISFMQAQEALLGEKQPSKTFVRPQDIGQMIRFLASPAADQITGTTLTMDGGWTAQ